MEFEVDAMQHLRVEQIGRGLRAQPRPRTTIAQSPNAKPTAAVRSFTASLHRCINYDHGYLTVSP